MNLHKSITSSEKSASQLRIGQGRRHDLRAAPRGADPARDRGEEGKEEEIESAPAQLHRLLKAAPYGP